VKLAVKGFTIIRPGMNLECGRSLKVVRVVIRLCKHSVVRARIGPLHPKVETAVAA